MRPAACGWMAGWGRSASSAWATPRAAELQASGHMGSVTVDLGGAWPAGAMTDVTVNNLMGELRLEAPSGLRLVGFGSDSPGLPALRLRVSNTMGETRLSRY